MPRQPELSDTMDVNGSSTVQAGVRDVGRLGLRMAWGLLRGRGRLDGGSVMCAWAREMMARAPEATGLRIAVPGFSIDLVGDRRRSEQILSGRPGEEYGAGRLKVQAMSFLAPNALTIADGELWRSLRPFNEQALGTGGAHPYAQVFLDGVRRSFARPVSDRDDVQSAMAGAMTSVVLGEPEDEDARQAARDVTALFGVVQNPVRRKLLGRFYRGRRTRLYALLRRRWRDANARQPTVLGMAPRDVRTKAEDSLLEQIPHWMFTFTGSGTDLLTRTLAMVTARSDVRRRVIEECAAAGPLDRAETVQRRLDFTRACVLETGRLFPPVTRTFHHPKEKVGGPEVAHYFPLLQRDDALGDTVHSFRPERWLAPELDEAARASNLFLRGPRACPGKDLILFVCTAAVARQVGELALMERASRLSRDPLPVSFPEREARFTAPEASR